MHNHNERADVLLNAVRLALPGERQVIRPNCFRVASPNGVSAQRNAMTGFVAFVGK